MSDKSELTDLSRDFLKAVAILAKTELGAEMERLQHAGWLVQGTGKHFERKALDRGRILSIYHHKLAPSNFSEQEKLKSALMRSGITEDEIPYDFFHPLIGRWLNLWHPFSFEEPAFSNLLQEFADAVLFAKIITRLRIAIKGFNAAFLPIRFDEDAVIRSITEEELWVLGDEENLESRFKPFPAYYPDSDWKILEVKFQCDKRTKIHVSEYIIFYAVLTALSLGSSGSLRLIDLGSQDNFGRDSIGYRIEQNRVPEDVGRYGGNYSLDQEMIQNLQSHWSQILTIMESDSNYLRLPAMRLIDGGAKYNPRDAIIDYSIGLESLLTGGENKELAFKFALRGATILSWNEGGRKDFNTNLHNFYKLRSSIVHGSHHINEKKLNINDARNMGEYYLRKIWWWYFTRNIPSIDKGIKIIDDRILDP